MKAISNQADLRSQEHLGETDRVSFTRSVVVDGKRRTVAVTAEASVTPRPAVRRLSRAQAFAKARSEYRDTDEQVISGDLNKRLRIL